ncbi:MAG: hypothetical protein M3032_00695 [Verrucomicrobiota bacterium]|nr:hypothetical protein [Verrucomicrobiota bacterium]
MQREREASFYTSGIAAAQRLQVSKTQRKPRQRNAAAAVAEATRAPVLTPVHWEFAGVLGLVALWIYFLSVSWRKWPDPLIDFGRELYLPWRIANGAVLYRDVAAHYGPFSQIFNALLFKVFGPGLMILVSANLLIFAAILATFYRLARSAWGATAAVASTATFISVFGFTQLVRVSNYNYATPYAHEVTHGMLVTLLLCTALVRWSENPVPRWSFLAGLLFGVDAVLKPEFVLAGGLLGIASAVIGWRYNGLPRWRTIVGALLGIALPIFAFSLYFAAFFPLREALALANRGWLRFATPVAVTAFTGVQAGFIGLDQARSNLAHHLQATAIALAATAAIAGCAWASKRVAKKSIFAVIALIATAMIGFISARFVVWPEIGKCLLGLSALYAAARFVFLLVRKVSRERLPREVARVLLAGVGAALMTRMALNGRIYHYGFYQAAVAACIVPAILTSETAEWVVATPRVRRLLVAFAAALFMPGILSIARASHALLAAKTAAVGEGLDRFYGFGRQIDPTAEIVAVTAHELKERPVRSLIVIPEGVMINYLARTPTPVQDYFFWVTSTGFADHLAAHAPEAVVLISRDLREYGIERYGANPGQGQEILAWLSRSYRQVAHAGGDPFDVRQRGAIILRRNDSP